MKSLTLLRHAKSGWDDPVARDFDRPVNEKGKKAAEMMGRYAREQGMQFDLMLSSPAVRCGDTLDAFFLGYGDAIDPHWDRRIYLASSSTLLDVLHDTPADIDRVIMVGHNPGLEDLILDLVPDDGSSSLRDAVEAKFPTASIAVMEWDGDDWNSLGKSPARLTLFKRPRDLDPTLGPDASD
ncbi:SixA phosphatase family protein [Sphingobium subterraneum]|uniref:Phosphohistidine phosphatase n=1 Tax=Sphingobium subterraneum TaxID=627688 RepID=A0A841IYW2_9SPHN|nr:histidine phosphatase family protein [Sphingobium subterraneum]MBB6123322.1 phosphohistidine phosphatase [Sphingobium subterraneum]